MSASRQGMSSEENGQGSDHGRDSNQQQSKRIEVVRAHATRVGNKKAYAGNLSYCNKCKWHHIRLCTVKCGNCKRVGHTTKNCRTSAPAKTKRALVANQKPAVTCFGCGAQRHFKSKCPRLKNQMYDNQKKKEGKIRKNSKAMAAYEANQNGNGNPNVNVGGVVPVARECTYQYFLKCQPLNFKGTERVDSALTWWTSHKRTIRTDAAYAITWKALMKLMTKVYCPRNEIQKIKTKLWNLAVKGNDLTAYTQRFQELILLCTKMVPEEEDRVKKFIGGLPDNIQGNVIATEPTRLQDAIQIANNLMDQKLKGYAVKDAENKRRFDKDPRDNRVQQPPFKRQNVARAYTVGNNKNKGYVRILPLRDKCKLHHHGSCPVRCGNCKKVGHQARDC
ncbi:putative reverse transcriptase domain-containing protein [Tanacetum coccineum]|uniref:Reverse transcriptase domain-containing protein n=1 Tax=Tanacetum coccineum TaxID=301880 RepID=A0ABQ5H0H0_9ASTR